MANPQCEYGFTKIANEIMEALARLRVPGEARQVLDVIIRKTYGFNKKEDAIALSQFCLATGLNKPHVCRALSKLKTINLITEKGNGSPSVYSLNKDFDTWKALPKKVTLPKKEMSVTEKGKYHYQKRYIQKKKETLTKDILSPHSQFIEFAFITFEEEFKDKLHIDGGKDGKIVQALLSTYGLDRLKNLWVSFIHSDDPFIRQAGYSVGVFKSQINKLVILTPLARGETSLLNERNSSQAEIRAAMRDRHG